MPPISSHLHPLQVVNFDKNSRLGVDEDDNGKFSLEGVNPFSAGTVFIRQNLASTVFIRQNLTYRDGPSDERITIFPMTVDP